MTTIPNPLDITDSIFTDAEMCAPCIRETRDQNRGVFVVRDVITDRDDRERLLRDMPTDPDVRCTRCGLRARATA